MTLTKSDLDAGTRVICVAGSLGRFTAVVGVAVAARWSVGPAILGPGVGVIERL